MSLNLIGATQEILQQVEDLTNKGFKLIEKVDLPYFAKVKPARKKMSHHLVFYRNAQDEIINHLIAHECGHIIRIFEAPESKRVIPFTSQKHLKIAMDEVKGEIKKNSILFQGLQINQLLNMWINGLVMQLTNGPPDLMIEKWLYDSYPDLRDFQFESIKRQWTDATAGMDKKIKKITPKKIFNSSNIMNYAFFKIIGTYINYNFLKPFSSTAFTKKGEKLAKITEKDYGNNFEGDVEKINEWANFLNLSKWFSWRDFEDIPDNYEEIV